MIIVKPALNKVGTCIDGKDGHEEDDVSAAEKDVEYFGDLALLFQRLFRQDHPQRKGEHDETVASVAEHHRKQEGEGCDSEGGGIHLSITIQTR